MESEKTRKSEKNTPADKRALKIFYNIALMNASKIRIFS